MWTLSGTDWAMPSDIGSRYSSRLTSDRPGSEREEREREREREREERGISSRQEKANLRRHERGVRRTF